MAYLVVEYDGGKQKQCNFKDERDVDALLDVLAKEQPQIKRLSAAGEQTVQKKEAEKAARKLPELTKDAEHSLTVPCAGSKRGIWKLSRRIPDELSAAERRKRAQLQSKPVYRYVALLIFLFGLVAAAYGLYAITNHVGNYGIYFALFGFAAIFLFSSYNMLPTARNNHSAIMKRADRAEQAAADYVKRYPNGAFPVPSYYAHPTVLKQMMDAIEEGRAVTVPEALEAVSPPEGAERRRSGRAGGIRRGRPHQGDVPEPPIRIREPTKAPRFRGAFVVPNFLHGAECRFIMRREQV